MKRKGSHVQADWKKCQPPPGLEPGTSAYHDQRSNQELNLGPVLFMTNALTTELQGPAKCLAGN